MKVYPSRDIRPFVMYCVNGKPRSSLLIESTDSMIFASCSFLRTMFKISIALRLFSYAAPLNKEGNSNMVETHTNGTPNPREWHSGRDVTFHFGKFYISVPILYENVHWVQGSKARARSS